MAVYGNTVVALGDVSAHTGPDTEIVDAGGRHLVPGLFDGHQHIECSKLSITSAAKMLVPHGTLNVVSGLDQILVVAGLAGAEAFLRESQATPLRVLWGAPCKTPYTLPTSTVGHYFGPDDHRAAQSWPECVGVWETVREFVTTGDPDVLAAMEIARQNRLPVLGCAPMATGADLTSYACGGIRLDHESYDADECLEKLRNGMYVVIRESSFAHFLTENIRLVTEHAPGAARRVSFCTDDVVASDVLSPRPSRQHGAHGGRRRRRSHDRRPDGHHQRRRGLPGRPHRRLDLAGPLRRQSASWKTSTTSGCRW